jgi:pentatricopeptide repeat protein
VQSCDSCPCWSVFVVDFLVIGKHTISWFQTQEDREGILAQQQTEPALGGSKGGCIATKNCTNAHFFMKCKACQTCQGWTMWANNRPFSANARRGHESRQIHFCSSLNACASLQALEEGKHVHRLIREHGCESDVYVGCNLIDMYAKCGSIEDAWRVFNGMPVHDVVTWSVIIMQFAECGWGWKALELFEQMWQEGADPNPVTFAGALNVCASVAALRSGQTCSWTCNSRWLWVWWLSAL